MLEEVRRGGTSDAPNRAYAERPLTSPPIPLLEGVYIPIREEIVVEKEASESLTRIIVHGSLHCSPWRFPFQLPLIPSLQQHMLAVGFQVPSGLSHLLLPGRATVFGSVIPREFETISRDKCGCRNAQTWWLYHGFHIPQYRIG
ncbi:unnamed protein product [Lactuca saligna]|uniref:Uncharacterized protein n=1 Tax=Lactuca saligna TaxID=75948 RepID=A0AA35Z0R1_LACSI|nr:unnamed protein product [Lactuca saligna]